MQERKGSCPERVGSFGEGEEVEVEVEKESTDVSTFEQNGGEASLCPTTHMPSLASLATRANDGQSINGTSSLAGTGRRGVGE